MADLNEILESPDPIAALEETGSSVHTSREARSSSTSVQGIEVTSSSAYACIRRWSLPSGGRITATFSQEGFKHMLIKLFKTELQVGDPLFDDAVYVTTMTEDETASWLESEQVQGAILNIVQGGGDVSIQDDKLIITVLDEVDPDALPDPREEAILVGSLIFR